MKLTKRKITITIGIILSFLFLYLALRKVDFVQTLQILANTNYFFIIPAAIIFFCDFSLRAFRWKVLLSPIKNCHYKNVLSITFIGYFATSILPMRAGEIIRAIMIGEKEKISKTSVIATIVLERVMDVFSILLLLFITLFILPYPENIRKMWTIAIVLFSLFLILFLGLFYYQSKTLKLLTRILKVLPEKLEKKVENLLESFIAGFEILKKGHHFLIAILISLSIWAVEATFFLIIAKGLGIHQINYFGSIFIVAMVALAVSVPASPSGIGVYEYFGILACSILGVEKSTGLSFTLLAHGLQFVLIVLLGMSFLAREHISLIQLEKKAEKQDQ